LIRITPFYLICNVTNALQLFDKMPMRDEDYAFSVSISILHFDVKQIVKSWVISYF